VCGIAGMAGGRGLGISSMLRPMVASQSHRGPDGEGIEVVDLGDVQVGLGHRRLAIIDLSEAGRQPMSHPQTGDVLVYNGELYNHERLREELEAVGVVFRGRSDTEVILHALSRWGFEAVDRMQGMFAFAFLDRANRRLLLARDPLGIKPLYFCTSPRGFAFASEIRSLLNSGLVEPEIDRGAVAGLLAYGAVQEPLTIFRNIHPLEPGTIVEVDLSPATSWRRRVLSRWSIPSPDSSITEDDAVAEVQSTLDASVRDHLISDVPVGVFLSAGVDSTILATLAARHSTEVRTFTIGFAEDPDLSEAGFTRRTAADLGLRHTEIQITAADALDSTRAWLASLDQPSMDGCNVYLIARAVRSQGITVALSGQGGDELFGGYASFRDVPRLMRTLGRIRRVPPGLRGRLAQLAMSQRPLAVREKARDMFTSDGSASSLYLQRRRVMSDSQLAALGIRTAELDLHQTFLPHDALGRAETVEGDPVATVSRLESRLYMGNMLLRDGDVNGMAHGLEIRVPYLDRRLLEVAYRIPGNVLLPPGAPGKHILRRAFGSMLRPELANLSKRGFTLPVRRWMLGPLRPVCEEALDCLKQESVLDKRGVDLLWNAFLADPESPIWSRALTLCVLGSFISRHGRRERVPVRHAG
jgi:asparagine synthase (glutamine-hydrolysing)